MRTEMIPTKISSPRFSLLPGLCSIPHSLPSPQPEAQGMGVTARSCHTLPSGTGISSCSSPGSLPRDTSLGTGLLQRGSPAGSQGPPGAASMALQGLPGARGLSRASPARALPAAAASAGAEVLGRYKAARSSYCVCSLLCTPPL